MPLQTDTNGRYIIHSGPNYPVVCAVRENGNSPAKEFIEQLEAQDKNVLRQFMVLFDRIGREGRIFNKQQFRHEQGEIWSFKKDQHRLPCYRDGKCFVVTHGFVKKKDKWLKSDFDTSVGIMQEDMARVAKFQKKGK
jgi:hypothetical protein